MSHRKDIRCAERKGAMAGATLLRYTDYSKQRG